MNKIGTKLVISLLVFVLTLGVLVTTTYAWITKDLRVTISDVSLTAGSGADMKLSLGSLGDPETDSLDKIIWKDDLTGEDIEKAIGSRHELKPVTTYNGKEFYRSSSTLKLADTLIELGDKNYENVTFMKIPMYFRVDKVESNLVDMYGVGIYLTDFAGQVEFNDREKVKGTFATSRGIRTNADTTYYESDGTKRNKGSLVGPYYAKESLRISFVQVQNIDFANKEPISDYLNPIIFDLSEKPNYGHVSSVQNKTWGFVSYYQAKINVILQDFPDVVPDVITGEQLTKFDENEIALNTNSKIANLEKVTINSKKCYIAKCYIYIWIEGWDVDCYDVILSDFIYTQFTFKMAYGPI